MTRLTETLHRLVKERLDSGKASTIEEAYAHFESLRLVVELGDNASSPDHHAALLTTVALGRRTFLGGVIVVGELDVLQQSRLPMKGTLHDAVVAVGGQPSVVAPAGMPRITVGTPRDLMRSFHVRVTFEGWRGAVIPATAAPLDEQKVMMLAPMLASALAVSEAFAHVTGDVRAGLRELGLSLWKPEVLEWRLPDGGPTLSRLPSRLWLLGLGHLGQAYLWGLGLLPFETGQLLLMLQDDDVATRSTESTSILTDHTMVGRRKTRIASDWAEARGFVTIITERRFDARTTPDQGEPRVALCGLDNIPSRQLLDGAGFDFVVEAGLGSTYQDFRSLVVHTLPANRPSNTIWRGSISAHDEITGRSAYQALIASGKLDQCGAITLAGAAVGAPWVGAVASVLCLSELLRLLHDGVVSSTVSVDLSALDFRLVTPRTLRAVNPGYVEIEADGQR